MGKIKGRSWLWLVGCGDRNGMDYPGALPNLRRTFGTNAWITCPKGRAALSRSTLAKPPVLPEVADLCMPTTAKTGYRLITHFIAQVLSQLAANGFSPCSAIANTSLAT